MSRKKVAHRFTVILTADAEGAGWTAEVAEVDGCISEGRSLAEARRNIREALSLFEEVLGEDPVEAANTAELVEDIRLPGPLATAMRRYDRAQKQLSASEDRFRAESRAAAAMLTARLGLRDAGELLGVSHQTAKNLASEAEPVKPQRLAKASPPRGGRRAQRAAASSTVRMAEGDGLNLTEARRGRTEGVHR